MAEATVMVADVQTKDGVGQKGPWKLYRLVDGNADTYTTFDGALGTAVEALKGKRAAITFEVTEKGNNLKSATPAAEPRAQGSRDPGDPVQVMIVRQNSWSHAAALTAASGVTDMGAKMLFEAAAPLAHMIELDVRRGYLPEEEVPF